MSDFEDRLGHALTEGVEDVPDTPGLAAGARQRAAVRRRTRSRVVVGAVVLAVVAAVVPLALLRDGGDAGPTVAQRGEQDDGWRTVTRDGLTFEVPDTWGDDVFASPCPGTTNCYYRPPTVTTEPLTGARDSYAAPRRSGGDDGGWVTSAVIDDVSLYVGAPSRAVAQRVMDSAYGGCAPRSTVSSRKTEQPALAQASATTGATLCRYTGEGGQVRLDVTERLDPEGATRLLEAMRQAPELHQMIVDCVAPVPYDATRVRLGDAEVWINDSSPCSAQMGIIDGVDVREVTPEVRAALDPDGWQTVEVGEVTLDLPGDWARLDTGACRAGQVRFGPPGTPPCGTPTPVMVLDTTAILIDGPPGLDAGFVLAGDQMVSVDTDDEDVARRILASARVDGEDPGDLDVPWIEQEQDGVTWSTPRGSAVQVRVLSGIASCAIGAPQFSATPVRGGRWRANWCANRLVTVTAPTQALADLVASTIDDEQPTPPGAVAWRTVDLQGVLLDVPAGWVPLDTAACRSGQARVGPPGTDPCATPAPLAVYDGDGITGLDGGRGFFFTGGRVISASTDDAETTRRILASARTSPVAYGLDQGWRTRPVGPYVVDVPIADRAGVRVRRLAGMLDGVGDQPARRTDRGWVGTASPNTYVVVEVVAPTQALADVVLSGVREP